MSAALYNPTILRLAASVPHEAPLADPHGVSEKRSPVCGSQIRVAVRLDGDGRIADLGQTVRACALGQASAALMAASARGRPPEELAAARDTLAAFLAGERDDPGDWPGLDIFAPARAYPARHPSIRLAFEAVAEAAAHAARRPSAAA